MAWKYAAFSPTWEIFSIFCVMSSGTLLKQPSVARNLRKKCRFGVKYVTFAAPPCDQSENKVIGHTRTYANVWLWGFYLPVDCRIAHFARADVRAQRVVAERFGAADGWVVALINVWRGEIDLDWEHTYLAAPPPPLNPVTQQSRLVTIIQCDVELSTDLGKQAGNSCRA